MATRALIPRASPLDLLLASVPSLPRPILARLAARMIARMDELDGEPDREPDDDDTAIDDGPCDGDADSEPGSWPEDEPRTGMTPTYGNDEREDDAPEVRRPPCKRIRATRCDRFVRDGHSTYRLVGPAADVMGVTPP